MVVLPQSTRRCGPIADAARLRCERTLPNSGETALWPMPPERSIDTLDGFEAAERLARG